MIKTLFRSCLYSITLTVLVLTIPTSMLSSNPSYSQYDYYHIPLPAHSSGLGKGEPSLTQDKDLKVEPFSKGLRNPTTMAFLGPDDILVLEKNHGTVKRIVNGTVLKEPLIDITVASEYERGMLGLAVSKEEKITEEGDQFTTYVYLFFTEGLKEKREEGEKEDRVGNCKRSNYCAGDNYTRNRLYRYELVDGRLVNPKLLLDLPGYPGADHIGGTIAVDPNSSNNNDLYVITGDGDSCDRSSCYDDLEDSVLYSKSSNFINGKEPGGRGGILRVSQDVDIGDEGDILGYEYPLNLYYAYGIRNGFGLDFDPVTGDLWDTENGPGFGDEINLVKPGFNSGWSKLQGVWHVSDYSPTPGAFGYFLHGDSDKNDKTNNEKHYRHVGFQTKTEDERLVSFNGNGKYSSPEFTWNITVAPTALKFLHSDKLGKEYNNDLFVGDFKNGNLYHFDLSKDRKQLSLQDSLHDKVANSKEELNQIIFGRGFNGISDIEVGPDGYLYVLSLGDGAIYRILPGSKK
jgi:glucose/arabinose dehydrogenase